MKMKVGYSPVWACKMDVVAGKRVSSAWDMPCAGARVTSLKIKKNFLNKYSMRCNICRIVFDDEMNLSPRGETDVHATQLKAL